MTALRVFGRRESGGAVELLLLKEREPGLFECLARPGKRIRPGGLITLDCGLAAVVQEDLGGGRKLVAIAQEPGWKERLASAGSTPLPPYIHEPLQGAERYQTVYADAPGSAAAPSTLR